MPGICTRFNHFLTAMDSKKVTTKETAHLLGNRKTSFLKKESKESHLYKIYRNW